MYGNIDSFESNQAKKLFSRYDLPYASDYSKLHNYYNPNCEAAYVLFNKFLATEGRIYEFLFEILYDTYGNNISKKDVSFDLLNPTINSELYAGNKEKKELLKLLLNLTKKGGIVKTYELSKAAAKFLSSHNYYIGTMADYYTYFNGDYRNMDRRAVDINNLNDGLTFILTAGVRTLQDKNIWPIILNAVDKMESGIKLDKNSTNIPFYLNPEKNRIDKKTLLEDLVDNLGILREPHRKSSFPYIGGFASPHIKEKYSRTILIQFIYELLKDYFKEINKLTHEEKDKLIINYIFPELITDPDNFFIGLEKTENIKNTGKRINGCYVFLCEKLANREIVQNYYPNFKDKLLKSYEKVKDSFIKEVIIETKLSQDREGRQARQDLYKKNRERVTDSIVVIRMFLQGMFRSLGKESFAIGGHDKEQQFSTIVNECYDVFKKHEYLKDKKDIQFKEIAALWNDLDDINITLEVYSQSPIDLQYANSMSDIIKSARRQIDEEQIERLEKKSPIHWFTENYTEDEIRNTPGRTHIEDIYCVLGLSDVKYTPTSVETIDVEAEIVEEKDTGEVEQVSNEEFLQIRESGTIDAHTFHAAVKHVESKVRQVIYRLKQMDNSPRVRHTIENIENSFEVLQKNHSIKSHKALCYLNAYLADIGYTIYEQSNYIDRGDFDLRDYRLLQQRNEEKLSFISGVVEGYQNIEEIQQDLKDRVFLGYREYCLKEVSEAIAVVAENSALSIEDMEDRAILAYDKAIRKLQGKLESGVLPPKLFNRFNVSEIIEEAIDAVNSKHNNSHSPQPQFNLAPPSFPRLDIEKVDRQRKEGEAHRQKIEHLMKSSDKNDKLNAPLWIGIDENENKEEIKEAELNKSLSLHENAPAVKREIMQKATSEVEAVKKEWRLALLNKATLCEKDSLEEPIEISNDSIILHTYKDLESPINFMVLDGKINKEVYAGISLSSSENINTILEKEEANDITEYVKSVEKLLSPTKKNPLITEGERLVLEYDISKSDEYKSMESDINKQMRLAANKAIETFCYGAVPALIFGSLLFFSMPSVVYFLLSLVFVFGLTKTINKYTAFLPEFKKFRRMVGDLDEYTNKKIIEHKVLYSDDKYTAKLEDHADIIPTFIVTDNNPTKIFLSFMAKALDNSGKYIILHNEEKHGKVVDALQLTSIEDKEELEFTVLPMKLLQNQN